MYLSGARTLFSTLRFASLLDDVKIGTSHR